MIKEFRNFINRGNVVELGVAFVMGASFKSLVDVFTKRLVEPVIGLVLNIPNLENLGLFGDIDPASGINAGSIGAFLGEKILKNVEGIGFTYFNDSDIVRHPLVKKIIVAYDANERKKGE